MNPITLYRRERAKRETQADRDAKLVAEAKVEYDRQIRANARRGKAQDIAVGIKLRRKDA